MRTAPSQSVPLHLEAGAVLLQPQHRDPATRPRWPSAKPCAVEVERLAPGTTRFRAPVGPNTMRIFSAEGFGWPILGDLGCGLTRAGRGPVRSGRSAHPGGRLLHHRCRPGQGGSGPAQAPGGRSHALPRQGLRLRGHRSGGGFPRPSGGVVRYEGNVLEPTQDTPAQTAVLTYLG